MKNFKNLIIAALFVFCVMGARSAWAVVELPDPYTIIAPGETIASQHDDFFAYSAKLNDALNLDGYDVTTGTGGLDVLVYTGAGTKDRNVNVGISPNLFTFQDPLSAPGGSATYFNGVWGSGSASINGPVMVDNVLNYLHLTFGSDVNVPVFNFDMNQTGAAAGQNIFMAGKVSIWDPFNNEEVAFWAFDSILNDQFDAPDLVNFNPFDPEWVVAIGDLTINDVDFNGVTGTVNVDHNQGSGKLDFIGVAPTMDLSQYYGKGYWFLADFYLGGLTDGFEELYLSGTYAVPPPVIPEPASMALFGLGLLGVARLRRKKA
jgi:hypothetical protein